MLPVATATTIWFTKQASLIIARKLCKVKSSNAANSRIKMSFRSFMTARLSFLVLILWLITSKRKNKSKMRPKPKLMQTPQLIVVIAQKKRAKKRQVQVRHLIQINQERANRRLGKLGQAMNQAYQKRKMWMLTMVMVKQMAGRDP